MKIHSRGLIIVTQLEETLKELHREFVRTWVKIGMMIRKDFHPLAIYSRLSDFAANGEEEDEARSNRKRD